jgi:multicomponent Na+:H+ antiporter subunit F
LAVVTLLAFVYNQAIFLDIALTYALLAFLSVLALARCLEGGKMG